MRVVSLSPMATAWMAALGGRHLLVGRSHACEEPPSVRTLPVLTVPLEAEDMPERTRLAHVLAGHLRFRPHVEAIRALEPDLVVVQEPCAVCVDEADIEALAAHVRVHRMATPRRFKEMLDAVLRLAVVLGMREQAYHLLGDAEIGVRELQHRLEQVEGTPPRVLLLVHTDPVIVGGHWVGAQITYAGGEPLATRSGDPPRRLPVRELPKLDPDVVILASGSVPPEVPLAGVLPRLRAYREGRVLEARDPGLFLRPGPGLYRGIHALAAQLFPAYIEGPEDACLFPWTP